MGGRVAQIEECLSSMNDAKLFLEYYLKNIPETEEEWKLFIKRHDIVCKKHGETEFITKILFYVTREIERVSKEC